MRALRRLLLKAEQLGLTFGGLSPKREPVKRPGSRGGHGYYDDAGHWQYGERQPPQQALTTLAGTLSTRPVVVEPDPASTYAGDADIAPMLETTRIEQRSRYALMEEARLTLLGSPRAGAWRERLEAELAKLTEVYEGTYVEVENAAGTAAAAAMRDQVEHPCPTCDGPTELRPGHFTTVGGLTLDRGRWCTACGKASLPTQADLAAPLAGAGAVPPGPWRLASSGLSVDAGDVRIRLSGGTLEARRAYAQALAAFPETGTLPPPGEVKLRLEASGGRVGAWRERRDNLEHALKWAPTPDDVAGRPPHRFPPEAHPVSREQLKAAGYIQWGKSTDADRYGYRITHWLYLMPAPGKTQGIGGSSGVYEFVPRRKGLPRFTATAGDTAALEAIETAIGMAHPKPQHLLSVSGRPVRLPPRIRTDSERKASADLRRQAAWLLEEARKEAASRGDEYVTTLLAGLDPKRMSQGDRDLAHQYLFGHESQVPAQLDPGGHLTMMKARTVKRPATRGGTGFFDEDGTWRYGRPPAHNRDLVGRRLRLVDQGIAFLTVGVDRDGVVCMQQSGVKQTLPADLLRRGIAAGKVEDLDALTEEEKSDPQALSMVRKAALAFYKAPRPRPESVPRPEEREPEGKVVLGKTRRGKPVYASGAETAGYNDQDHADAGALHAQASAHHDGRAGGHRMASDTEDADWTRGEAHHQESERHGRLAEHHHDLARLHLTAAGQASHVDLDTSGEAPALGAPRPADARERGDAKRRLAARTHHEHPGGLSTRDREAYATLGKGEPDGVG